MSHPLIVSAPGKVILHGEHAVVYGKVALATSLDLRCYLILTQTQDRMVTLHLPEFVPDSDVEKVWNVSDLESATKGGSNCDHEEKLQLLRNLSGIEGDEAPSIQSMAVLVFLYLLSSIYNEKIKELSGLSATIISNLPAGAGLGSSAAYSVCLATGFLSYCGKMSSLAQARVSNNASVSDAVSLQQVETRMKSAGIDSGIGSEEFCWSKEDMELINKWGFEAEKLIHGTPSGIDNSISTYGGAISFKSGVITHLEKMPSIRILLINTKVPRSTKKMVAGVRERYNKFTPVISPLLDSIDNITTIAQSLLGQLWEQQALTNHQDKVDLQSQLEELFRVNQHLLNALGVGHPAIDKACSLAASLGLSAKLTGGGGGGCVVAFLPHEISATKLLEFKSVFRDASFECWETKIACGGVCTHSVTT